MLYECWDVVSLRLELIIIQSMITLFRTANNCEEVKESRPVIPLSSLFLCLSPLSNPDTTVFIIPLQASAFPTQLNSCIQLHTQNELPASFDENSARNPLVHVFYGALTSPLSTWHSQRIMASS